MSRQTDGRTRNYPNTRGRTEARPLGGRGRETQGLEEGTAERESTEETQREKQTDRQTGIRQI